jgi:hypothetical protein
LSKDVRKSCRHSGRRAVDGEFCVDGEETVTRVEEQCGTGLAPEFLFPDRTPDALQKHRNWMVPDFFREAEDKFTASIHTWVVRTRLRVILSERLRRQRAAASTQLLSEGS